MLDILDAILVMVFAYIVPLLVTAGCLYVLVLALLTSMEKRDNISTFDKIELFSIGFLYLFTCIWFWGWIAEASGNSEAGYAHAGVVVALVLFLVTIGIPIVLKRTFNVPYTLMAVIYAGIMLFGL